MYIYSQLGYNDLTSQEEMIMDLIKNNGYATRKNAIAKLVKVGVDLQNDRWLIASTDSGRFEPVLVGVEYADYAFLGVTVTA